MLLTSTKSQTRFPGKIISLVPSQTELLFYLALTKEVVGITKFCVHPDIWFKSKTRIGGTKTVNIDAIRQLQPDLIIANKEENVKDQVECLAREFNVWVTDVNSLDEALQMISDVGELTATTSRCETLQMNIRDRFRQIPKPSHAINACYLVWQDPFMAVAGGTFINDMMHYCGLQNIFHDWQRYPVVTLAEIEERNCDVLLLPSEPYPFRQVHADELQARLPRTRIALADGEMFSWYGSRLLESPKYFTSLLHTLRF